MSTRIRLAVTAAVTHARPGDRIEARNKRGAACRHPSCHAARVAAGRTSAYTAMVNDKGIKVWACMERRNGNGVCTDWY